ncbi:hypothetical protein [Streptomyces avermitilis]|uniref:hypothetical protein n=1 Tax=Streptomyces avermitilis TaxID=33903 RepID=UPI0038180235
MGEAESKAALAGVYSQGKEPRLISVSDSGLDEAWAIGETLFIVPAIPPDAPPLLEYALRVRREATFTGRCSDCGATVGLLTFVNSANPPLNHSSIPHRNNCPALDENLTPLLLEHYKQRAGQTLEQQLQSATKQTRLKAEATPKDKRIPIKNAKFEKWATKFIDDRLKDAPACGHLKADFAQTWNMSTGDRTWKCNECFAYYQESVRKGEAPLSYQEEYTCDRCRKFSPPLEPMMIRVDNFFIVGAMCSACSAESQESPEPSHNTPRTGKGKRRGSNSRKRR